MPPAKGPFPFKKLHFTLTFPKGVLRTLFNIGYSLFHSPSLPYLCTEKFLILK